MASDDYPIDSDELNPTITLPDLLPVQVTSKPEQLREASLQLVNTQIAFIHAGWGQVKSIRDIALLGRSTIEAIKARYDVLGVPYGYQAPNSKRTEFNFLD